MTLSRVFAIPLRYWYLLRGSPQRILHIFIWSTFDILVWGFVTKYLATLGAPAVNLTSILLGTLIFWQLITRVQQGFITIYLEDVWSRNLMNIFASPMSVPEYLSGIILTSFTTSFFAFSLGAGIAALAFGLLLPPIGLSLFALVAILVLFGVTLGILSAAIILRLGPSAEWFAWPVPAVLQPFVGVFYPIAILPGWMQGVAYLLPPSYVFDGLRAIFSGNAIDWSSTIFALGLSTVYLLLVSYLFVRIYRWAIRVGAIARYSAESFS